MYMYAVKIDTDESFKTMEVRKIIIDTSFLLIREKIQNFVYIYFSCLSSDIIRNSLGIGIT
jgi:hypothetical protein